MTSRNQSLDVLRAVAVLLVILCHARVQALEAGWVGVDLFFVLSGFLISGLLYAEQRSCGDIAISRFLIRRGLKIYPAYFFFLALTALLFPHLRHYLPMQIAFLQNYLRPAQWTHVLDPSYQLWDHTWSLAVEEHFYLGLPVLLLALSRWRRLHLVPGISLVLILVCFAVRWRYAAITGAVGGHPMFLTHQRIDALFAGVALGYLYYFNNAAFTMLSRPVSGVVGIALLAISLSIIQRGAPSPLLTSLILTVNLVAFSLILLWAVPTTFRGTVWLAEIGKYSYSIYLWHTVIAAFWAAHPFSWWLVIGQTVCAISVGVAMGVIVEFPVLSFRDKFFPSLTQTRGQLSRLTQAQVIPGRPAA